jgi:periplasmic divalent cation tolerance protein
VIVYATFKDKKEALDISRALLEDRLIACSNIIDGAMSVYRWNGETVTDTEAVAVMKSRTGLFGEILKKIKELHSYEIPSVSMVELKDLNPAFGDWIAESVRLD